MSSIKQIIQTGKRKFPVGCNVKWTGAFYKGFEVGNGIVTGHKITSIGEGDYILWAIIDNGRKKFIILNSDDPNHIPAITEI